jgi:erythromycin esterase-like protein
MSLSLSHINRAFTASVLKRPPSPQFNQPKGDLGRRTSVGDLVEWCKERYAPRPAGVGEFATLGDELEHT